uniref:Uncharacterized protein n=1 Tax=Arundo donax TaxID=35708 RepID=A0A0A9ADD9_ARUDO
MRRGCNNSGPEKSTLSTLPLYFFPDLSCLASRVWLSLLL